MRFFRRLVKYLKDLFAGKPHVEAWVMFGMSKVMWGGSGIVGRF